MLSDGRHIGVGLLEGNARLEAAHDENEMKVVIDLFGLEGQRQNDGISRETVREAGFEDTDDCVLLALQVKRRALTQRAGPSWC